MWVASTSYPADQRSNYNSDLTDPISSNDNLCGNFDIYLVHLLFMNPLYIHTRALDFAAGYTLRYTHVEGAGGRLL